MQSPDVQLAIDGLRGRQLDVNDGSRVGNRIGLIRPGLLDLSPVRPSWETTAGARPGCSTIAF